MVTTREGDSSGPPGVGLVVSGENYDCSQVTLVFSGDRFAEPTVRNGSFQDSELTVPGGARPGVHTVTADCGGASLVSATFRVTERAVHRPDLVTELPTPDDVSFSLADLAKSAGTAAVVVPMIFFPFAIIEEVMDDNWDEIIGWFGRKSGAKEKTGWRAIPIFVVFMGITAAFYTALSPKAALDIATVAAFVGLFLGISAVVMSEGSAALRFARRRRIQAPMRALPGSLAIALLVVVLSRLIHFHPGYAFGAVAGFHIADELERRDHGRLALNSVLSILGVSMAAWVIWLPVSRITSEGNPRLALVILEAALASTFMVGLETSVILALPIRFVHGGDVAKWNKWAWAGMFALVLVPAVHIMSARGNHTLVTRGVHPLVIIGVTGFFAVFTICFWGYFRFRPERPRASAVG